jgi:hypothetical protein
VYAKPVGLAGQLGALDGRGIREIREKMGEKTGGKTGGKMGEKMGREMGKQRYEGETETGHGHRFGTPGFGGDLSGPSLKAHDIW